MALFKKFTPCFKFCGHSRKVIIVNGATLIIQIIFDNRSKIKIPPNSFRTMLQSKLRSTARPKKKFFSNSRFANFEQRAAIKHDFDLLPCIDSREKKLYSARVDKVLLI